jgi:Ca2+-binding EF-hand superfamily protein
VFDDDLVYPEFIVTYRREFFHEKFADIYVAMFERRRRNQFNGPTPQETDVLKSMWSIFSMPTHGKIDKWQLLDLLNSIGQPPQNEQEDLDETFSEWDRGADGKVDYEDFLAEMCQRVDDQIEYYR